MTEDMKAPPRGVVVEFDFTALDGAQILFDTARALLAGKDVDLTVKLEAMHLAGGNYHGGLAELFQTLGRKCDAGATARELAAAFSAALTERVPAAVTDEFKAFINALTARGLRVVIATRADVETVRPAFADFDPAKVTLYAETSTTYGNCKWDAWRRVLAQTGLTDVLSVAVTGSGAGVKSALVAGMSALAVVHDHVAYQDFGGADEAVAKIDGALASTVFAMLHI